MIKIYVVSLSDNKIYEVWKFIKDSEGLISVWCDNWYGRHVIGEDCKFFIVNGDIIQ